MISPEFKRFPNEWKVLPFLEVFEDVTSKGKKVKKENYQITGDIPVVDQGQKFFGGYTDEANKITGVDLPAIVFGDHTKAFKYVEVDFAIGADGVKLLNPKIDADKKFLFYYLKQLKLEDAGYSRHFKFLKETYIPLPPLETQKKIAAVLEKADQLRKDCQQMEQELNSLAQSVFIDMFVGKDFPLVNLEDLASNKKHALSSGPFGSALSSKHYTDEGVLVLRGLNTTKGKIDLSKTKYISQEKYEELKRSKLSVNDVVVVAVGSSGFAISIPDGFPEAVMSQNFNKISPNMDLIVPKYLEFAINSSFVQRQFSREITDTVRTFLSLTKLKKVQIPLPPLELQKQFLSTIKSILKEEELNQEFVSEMDNCFSSLMQKAFKGELTL
ncbi:hypothetical protein BOO30_07375 [Vibrio navarrensis]|uniref:restriction endonuclease subunit S n=1 Tax=Vibrio navarrensis TaxID=29495 RepID=UPI001D043CB5|nr:restriction endonuclease subunit S [Vibrio navarrensis]MBE4577314.1 hypothetical protein [Vibrio navarrensis]MBE4596225.1 hypothetical protein [Vibrio navarrensis]